MPQYNKGVGSNTGQKILLLSIVSIFWFSQYVYVPYQTPYLSSIGLAPHLVGIVIGAYGLSQLILRLPVGLMADLRGKHKGFLQLGIFSSGFASLLRIFLSNQLGFLIGNLFSGLASAMWISFMILFFRYYQSNELQKASGLIVGANNFGILAGFVISTLLYQHFGIRLLCILSAAAAIPGFLLTLFIREPTLEFKALPAKELVQIYSNKKLIVFSLFALIQQGIQISTSMSFTAQVAASRGASGMQIGLCSIIYISTAVLSSYFAASKVAQRHGAAFWIPVIFACLGAYCVLIPNLPTVEWIYPVQILSGLSTGILFSFCTSEAMKQVPPEKKSTAMGFFQAVYALGMTTFPIFTGALTSTLSIDIAFYCLAGIAVIGLVGAVVFYRFCRDAFLAQRR